MRRKGIWKEFTGWAGLEGQWLRRKHFSRETLARIAERIRQSEQDHTGELVVAVEAVTPAHVSNSEQRALEVFGRLRVWDTPLNSGVLLYLALDRHHIQIVADRGIAAPDDLWAQVCERLQASLRENQYAAGILAAVDDIEAILKSRSPALPSGASHVNDLPDELVLL